MPFTNAQGEECLWGIDISFDELTVHEAAMYVEAGLDIVMQCLWTGEEQPPSRVVSLRNAQSCGLLLGGYISSTPGQHGADHVDDGRQGVPDDLWEALVRVPIDLEIPTIDYEMHVASALRRIEQIGKPQDVYTSWGFWTDPRSWTNGVVPLLGAGVGLWDASWGMNPLKGFLPRQYAGVTPPDCWGLQFEGDSPPNPGEPRQTEDRNAFRRSAFIIDPPPEPTPAPVDPRRLKNVLATYEDGSSQLLIPGGNP